MRRVTMMLAAIAVMVPLFAGVAYAATIEGNVDSEILIEGNLDDTIFGRGGGDEIRADAFGPEGFLTCGEPPAPCAGPDTDEAKGNAGDDFISVDDGDTLDTATGGKGNDVCVGDALAELNCEDESIGSDPGATVGPPPGF
jgi:hypothetical protein